MDYKYAILVLTKNIDINDIPILYRKTVSDLIKDNDKLLSYIKSQKWEEMKLCRNKTEQAGLPFKGKVLDYDILSVIRLNQAKDGLNALIANGTMTRDKAVIDWTMQDNTVMQLTIDDLEVIPIYAVQYSNELHQKARKLRNIISNCNNIEEILNIKW